MFSVDVILVVWVEATFKSIARCLVNKWKQPYPRTCGYIKSRVAITLVRETHILIWGSQVPAHNISVSQP